MKCPIDDTALVMADRQGVEIDYCPKCRGVWLDRGELDKIIERSQSVVAAAPPPPPPPQTRGYSEQEGYGYDDDRRRQPSGQRPKKRESLLSELFDF